MPLVRSTVFNLTWYYYSYSHIYDEPTRLTQLAGGASAAFSKTALLGAAFMTPVMANILMINLLLRTLPVGAECAATFLF